MAINDISLTAGMRSNLLSLQDTVNLLNRTQNRLSTGKKVNTAIDNPVSFFASQTLTSRASKIDSLKDAMGQAVQTITAADKGIKAITAMIEQAKGIAQAALSADMSSGFATGSITLDGIAADDTITIGGVLFTAAAPADTKNGEFLASGNNTIDAYSLADAINNTDWSGKTNTFKAFVNNGVLSISSTVTASGAARAVADGDFAAAAGNTGTADMTVVSATTELKNLQDQYNEMRNQISAVANDSGYKGKNLLSSDPNLSTLDVKFEGNTLKVEGFNATAGDENTGLKMTTATWTAAGTAEQITTAIGKDLNKLDAALDTMRQNASKLAGNLSIITVRQDFSTNMINTLTEGSDKLTLADTNEEGANMLMLQTRQSLSTTALSLSAQAAQSVLRLFG